MAQYLYDKLLPKVVKLVVIFDYKAESNEELSVCAGEEVKVIKNVSQHWIEVKSKDGKAGLLPLAYLRIPGTLESYPWFFPELTKQEAFELLIKEPPGTYLVRPSSVEKMHVLTIRTHLPDTPIAMYRIRYNEFKCYFIHVNLTSLSLKTLMSYYQNDTTNKLNLKHRLLKICPKSTPRIFQLTPYNRQIDANEIKLVREISKGNFGRVSIGFYRQFRVAIKELHNFAKEEWDKEIIPLSELHHPNVVTFYGFCNSHNWMIFEFIDYCLLHQLQNVAYSDNQLLTIIIQIARGMTYIHSNNYIHRDLAARNILVTKDRVAKRADFGLCRKIKLKGSYSTNVDKATPVLWEALETLDSNKKVYSKATDVWSFGVLLFEIYSQGQVPFRDIRMDQFTAHLKQGERLDKSDRMPLRIFNLQMECMDGKPKKRPTFKEILRFFSTFESSD